MKNLVKYKPNQEQSFLERVFNDGFDDIFRFPSIFKDDDFFRIPSVFRENRFNLLNDLSETEKEIKVEFTLPGFKKEEIKLEFNSGILSISAERKEKDDKKHFHSKVQKSYSLPENLDTEKIEAKLEDGVLTVTIPKLEEDRTDTKYIEIQ